jgi:hypothetical protein
MSKRYEEAAAGCLHSTYTVLLGLRIAVLLAQGYAIHAKGIACNMDTLVVVECM